ncbi:MAG: hypothetical protein HC908_04145 [Calothrix sp. SM1_7_51]|nr:hypothetical protein [Calothrix sp. SM1_7_51]
MEELQATVIIAIAACPNVEHRFISAESVRFRFARKEGLENFLRGISYYQRLQAVVADLEVIVTYVD